uniref:Uncharacterized protein n=1 Tax=Tanacetum cinerariifolium TaxID=118510 RepID=A0A699KJT5_TANCI|nr:hypothetical protein [Tanacetum cinerariifolium]
MEEPSHSEFDTGAEDQPIIQSSQHPEWFSQPQKPLTPDRYWNKTLPAVHGSIQSWISKLAKQADTRSFFNELMDTPLDFSNFIMNRLRVDTLTPELLTDPTYDLMKGSCKSMIELEYHLEEVYKATTDQLDLVNLEGQQESPIRGVNVSSSRVLLLTGNLLAMYISREESLLSRNSKLWNGIDTSTWIGLRDGTLTDVRIALDDRLKGIRMRYLPQIIWRKSDKDRAAAMIQAIDKRLKTRRITRSLERFVGGRLYEGDFRMLQRII